ncbi:Cation efflux protein [Candidatus Omnitrophus magneticus]|uniref:Cation efflux protein n=1 Tax=Candidatus Omnitrophus magneticus TaxID=1609969 RepID=A0A0F0CNZ6_9BACT|nr:Cation efflux protein [Candidatus Omnitrophus magneticus]
MYYATMISLLCNVFLVAMKAVALVLVNSLAIAMDLGISIVGLVVSIILYYSIKLSIRPADALHNYGYGKIEHVCEAMEGLILIGIAMTMSSQAILNFFHPHDVTMPWVGLLCSAVSATLNFVGAYYILILGRKSNSPAISAEGLHYRLEGFISGIIAVAFIAGEALKQIGYQKIALYMDPLAALSVSIIVVIPSFQLAKHSFFKLLDASLEEGNQLEIIKFLAKYMDRYCEFKDIKTRTAGREKFIEFKLIVPQEISFKKGYEAVSLLEKDIKASIPDCEVTVKMEPCDGQCSFSKTGSKCPYL